jgi:hypothetical protein
MVLFQVPMEMGRREISRFGELPAAFRILFSSMQNKASISIVVQLY